MYILIILLKVGANNYFQDFNCTEEVAKEALYCNTHISKYKVPGWSIDDRSYDTHVFGIVYTKCKCS